MNTKMITPVLFGAAIVMLLAVTCGCLQGADTPLVPTDTVVPTAPPHLQDFYPSWYPAIQPNGNAPIGIAQITNIIARNGKLEFQIRLKADKTNAVKGYQESSSNLSLRKLFIVTAQTKRDAKPVEIEELTVDSPELDRNSPLPIQRVGDKPPYGMNGGLRNHGPQGCVRLSPTRPEIPIPDHSLSSCHPSIPRYSHSHRSSLCSINKVVRG